MQTLDLPAIAHARRYASTGEARRLRQASRLKITEVAAFLEKTPATISRWESGDRTPNAADALRWLKLLRRLERDLGSVDAGDPDAA